MFVHYRNAGGAAAMKRVRCGLAAWRRWDALTPRSRCRANASLPSAAPAGFRCVVIEISNAEIGGLVRHGLLPADDRNDLDAIQTAVYDFFEQTIGRPS